MIELLVVLAVSGLLTMLMVTGFRTAQGGWQHIAARDDALGRCKATRQFLGSVLSEAYPAIVGDGDAGAVVDFSGQPDQVAFLAPLPQRFGATDIVRYTLQFTREGDLHVAWRLDRTRKDGFSHEMDTQTLLGTGNMQSGFAYYGKDAQGDSRWNTVWHEQKALPALIRLRLGLCAKDGDLLVAPRITLAGCVDAASGRCGA